MGIDGSFQYSEFFSRNVFLEQAIFFNRRWNLVFRGDHRGEASDLMGVEEREYTKSIYTEVILDKNCIRLWDAAPDDLFFQKFVLSKAV